MLYKPYTLDLVVLSVLIATIGAYVAVEIAQRVRAAQRGRRLFWISGGAVAMGLGIWSMHFVGMLALHVHVLVWYDALLIFLSFVAAVIGCGIAFVIFNRATVGAGLPALASVFMGFAIAGMHYIGMAGMRMSSHVIYDPIMVAASVGVAIIGSFLALPLTRTLIPTSAQPHPRRKKTGA